MRILPATLLECLFVVGGGTLLGLAANAVHPDGLKLGRNYFPSSVAAASDGTTMPAAPRDPPHDPPRAPPPGASPGAAPAATSPASDPVVARLASKGLAAITFDEVKALFEDPLNGMGAYVFIDARNDEHFAAGHIPGALQLDHYHLERYIDAVLSAVPGALKVVVYCTGGNCEDSEFAATDLLAFGVPAEQLVVYLGGIEEWQARGMPLESDL